MPSECPFREEVLREVEEMRKRKEEEKEQRRYDLIEESIPISDKSEFNHHIVF